MNPKLLIGVASSLGLVGIGGYSTYKLTSYSNILDYMTRNYLEPINTDENRNVDDEKIKKFIKEYKKTGNNSIEELKVENADEKENIKQYKSACEKIFKSKLSNEKDLKNAQN